MRVKCSVAKNLFQQIAVAFPVDSLSKEGVWVFDFVFVFAFVFAFVYAFVYDDEEENTSFSK